MTITETVPVVRPTTDGPLISHWVCGICHPDPKPGDTALCGYVTKGEIPDGRDTQNCAVCEDVKTPHFVGHALRHDGIRP